MIRLAQTAALAVALLLSIPVLAQHEGHSTAKTSQSGGQMKPEASKVLAAYYDIKDALVATNAKEASQQADAFLKTLKAVDHGKMSAAEMKSFAAYSQNLEKYAREIQKNKNVEKQRSQFDLLSKEMTTFAKEFKPEKTYVQYCPMAADGKGASWLSSKKEIANPYYGSRMMRCGKVTEEI
ncbi:hypothetical protein GCM10023187_23850 [Nibrella viscosa]|uniref:DUF3347 domain-containing protein n=1 Tax=Nibrella viscosa TaxID=1084524 RepID=A0ABP8KG55_9BACT